MVNFWVGSKVAVDELPKTDTEMGVQVDSLSQLAH